MVFISLELNYKLDDVTLTKPIIVLPVFLVTNKYCYYNILFYVKCI